MARETRDNPFRLRPVREEDLPGMADCHAAAFPGEFLTALGRPFLESLYGHIASDPEGICLVATDARGKVAGLVAGGSPRVRERFVRRRVPLHLPRLVWRSLADRAVRARMAVHAAALLARIAALPRRLLSRAGDPSAQTREASLLSICAHPGCRGLGVGSRLMRAFEAAARRAGCATMRLSVRPHNAAAIALYLKSGWSILRREPGGVYFAKPLLPPEAAADSPAPKE